MHTFISLINRNKNTVISVVAMLLVSLSTMYFFWTDELSQQHQASVAHFSAIAEGRSIEWKNVVEEVGDDQCAFVINPDAEIIYFDPEHLHKLGYSEPEVINQEFFKLIHPEDLPDLSVSVLKALQSGEKMDNVGPYRFKSQNGNEENYHYFIATLTPVKDDSNKVTNLVIVQKDITYGIGSEKEKPKSNKPSIRDQKDKDQDRHILVDKVD